MRKIILAATVAAFALTVSACSEAAEEAPVEEAAVVEETNADAMAAEVAADTAVVAEEGAEAAVDAAEGAADAAVDAAAEATDAAAE